MTESSEETATENLSTESTDLSTDPPKTTRSKEAINKDYVNAMLEAGEAYNRAISIRRHAEALVAQEQAKLDALHDKYTALNQEAADCQPTAEEMLAQVDARKHISKQYFQSKA